MLATEAGGGTPSVPPAPWRLADEPIRASELIRVLRRMPKVRQTAALVAPSFSASIAMGRPP